MKSMKIATLVALLASPVLAEGDAAAGESKFERNCTTCHAVVDASGNAIIGRANVKTGPNLFGVVGRTAGTEAGFDKYGDSLVAAGAAGGVFDEAALVAYMQDPTAWLRSTLSDDRARSKMSFKLRNEQDAADIAAYLASLN